MITEWVQGFMSDFLGFDTFILDIFGFQLPLEEVLLSLFIDLIIITIISIVIFGKYIMERRF